MARSALAVGGLEVGRPILVLYALGAVVLSLVLVLQSRLRGPQELLFWLAAYGAVALASWWRPRWSPLVAGAVAFLLGIVKTHRAGPNLDLGLSLILLSVGVFTLDRLRPGARRTSVDPAGLALLLVAVWSAISLGFALTRIRGFTPAPGFDYHVYPFNALRFTSDEAVIRAWIGAAAMFAWFGLYEYGRSAEISRRLLRGLVAGLLLVNAAALLVQQHVDPFFLLHAGRPIGRFNGVTSYCYALGDATLALFLLWPAWGSHRGRSGLLTVGILALLAHAVQASGSRTALLAMLLGATLWALVRALRAARARPGLAAGLCLGGAAVALVLATWVYRVTPADRVSPVGRLKFGIERDGVLGHLRTTRLSSYLVIARVLAEYPLSGVGSGLYLAEVSKQHALLAPEVEIRDPFLLSTYAPNQFLNLGAELGVPALIALVGVFAWAGARAFSRRKEGHGTDLTVSLLTLALALQVTPSFYTSEALVFFWLLIGRAAGPGPAAVSGEPEGRAPRLAPLLIAGATLLALGAQVRAAPSLAVESQWTRLRWPMNLGLFRREEGGRWTRPQATFMVDAPSGELRLRWHAGDVAVPDYRPMVRFYVDGELVERSHPGSGLVHESVWTLPDGARARRVSVRVDPAFRPVAALGGEDSRRLGIFIHKR